MCSFIKKTSIIHLVPTIRHVLVLNFISQTSQLTNYQFVGKLILPFQTLYSSPVQNSHATQAPSSQRQWVWFRDLSIWNETRPYLLTCSLHPKVYKILHENSAHFAHENCKLTRFTSALCTPALHSTMEKYVHHYICKQQQQSWSIVKQCNHKSSYITLTKNESRTIIVWTRSFANYSFQN